MNLTGWGLTILVSPGHRVSSADGLVLHCLYLSLLEPRLLVVWTMCSCLALLLVIVIHFVVQGMLFHFHCFQIPINLIHTLAFPFLILIFDCHIIPASFHSYATISFGACPGQQ